MAKASDTPKPDKKPPKKADNATIAKRVEEVLRIVLDGAQHHDIVQYAAEKKWGVNDRQLRTYATRALDLLVERQERSRKRTIAKHIAQREALYARAVNAADLRTALAVLTDLAKLRGLYPVANIADLLKLAVAQEERIRQMEEAANAAANRAAATKA